MPDFAARSPLQSGLSVAPATMVARGLNVAEARGMRVLSVRCWRGLANAPELVATRLGARPSEDPNSVVEGGDLRLAWREPNCWLVFCDDVGRRAAIRDDADRRVRVTDVSSGWCVVRIEGESAARLLAAGCPLDFGRFDVGAGASSVFNGVDVYVQRTLPYSYLVAFDRALAAAFWADLTEAARYLERT